MVFKASLVHCKHGYRKQVFYVFSQKRKRLNLQLISDKEMTQTYIAPRLYQLYIVYDFS